MSKEAFQVFEARYKMKTPYEAPDDLIVSHTHTLSVMSVHHTYQRGHFRIVFEGMKVATSDASPGIQIPYPGHAEEVIKVSELAVAMKRGLLGGQELEDAIEITGESIYRAVTRARSASAMDRRKQIIGS